MLECHASALGARATSAAQVGGFSSVCLSQEGLLPSRHGCHLCQEPVRMHMDRASNTVSQSLEALQNAAASQRMIYTPQSSFAKAALLGLDERWLRHPNRPFTWNHEKIVRRAVHNPQDVLQQMPKVPSDAPIDMGRVGSRYFKSSSTRGQPNKRAAQCKTVRLL